MELRKNNAIMARIPAIILIYFICLLSSGLLMAQTSDQMKYTDAGGLMLLGKGFENTDSYYTRLPVDMKGEFRSDLSLLGKNSAGLAIRFSSNSTSIGAKWRVMNNFSMNHMPSTGIRGMDLYSLAEDGKWYYMGTARPSSGKDNKAVFISNMESKQREYIAYLPLYDGVESVEIGVDSTANIEMPRKEVLVKKNNGEAIVFYGTSITQGGCASRPGMGYTSIVGRMLQKETINLGFSGNGRLDRSIAKAISRINTGTVVLDCLPNCTSQILKDSAYTFVTMLLEAKPSVKIFMVENPRFPASKFDIKNYKDLTEENQVWKSIYDRLRKEGHRNIYYIKWDKLIGDDNEATVDGVHMTDLGFMRYAEEFLKYLK